MILGGGILNTFLKAKGYEVGKSLTDSKFLNEAADILNSSLGSKIFLPSAPDFIIFSTLLGVVDVGPSVAIIFVLFFISYISSFSKIGNEPPSK